MSQHSSTILSLTNEAAVLVEKNRISFVNSAARRELGSGCEGRSVAGVFGTDVAEAQAASFIANVPIKGRHYTVRVSKVAEGKIIFLSPNDTAPPILNEAFLFSARQSLSTMNFSLNAVREHAQNICDSVTLSNIAALTRGSYSLQRLVNNANLVLGIYEGKLLFTPRMVNLSQFLSVLADTVSRFYPQISFRMNMQENISAQADPALLETTFLNLISNCISHAAGCSVISISLAELGESIILSVSDDGCGIEPEQLHSVFDRYRHGFDLAQLSGGCGIGMTVVRGIAQVHGGTLLLESRPKAGTTVRFSIKKNGSAPMNLHTACDSYTSSMNSILTGLADCLPLECFSEKYMD